jgi:endogenous inhibitor of DNA gyrase (YacG/DUF329 family)
MTYRADRKGPGATRCAWCGAKFQSRVVGAHLKRFCSTRCQDRFHAAARRWAERAIVEGRLSLIDLKASGVSCTTRGGGGEG